MLNKIVRSSRNLFILGGLLAVVAFGLAFSVLSKAQQAPTTTAAPPPPTPIPAPALIARTNVPVMAQITDPQVALSQYFRIMPVKGYIMPDYVKGPQGLAELLALGPRHMAIGLAAGQPLLASELISNTLPGAIDYSSLLLPGEVAETIAVQPTSSGNGNIQPSDHVDVLVSYKVTLANAPTGMPGVDHTSSPATTWESQTTLQNLRVLNVASTNFTLAMSHQDALVLKWAKDTSATIDLVVRAADDSGRTPRFFRTTALLPNFILHDPQMRNKFVLP
jgi:Flp pilus assembly protein CpaB